MKKREFQSQVQQYLDYCNGTRLLGFSKKKKKVRTKIIQKKVGYTHTIKISIQQSGCFGDCCFKAMRAIFFLKKSKHELS